MRKWKLIALDMDGTLLRTDKSLHPDTIRDIREAVEQGAEFVYCSGRSIPELLLFADQLPMIRYAVCLSGALVYDFKEKKILFRKAIPGNLVNKILEAAEGYDPMLHFLMDTETVVRADQVTHMIDFCRPEFQETFLLTTRPVTDMKAEALKYDSIAKFNIYCHCAGERYAIYEKLKDLPLTVVEIEEASLEINALGVSKAAGMQALAGHLGIRMDEIMAVGDSENDRAVLQAVGFSVAMQNAEETIKSLCDAVTIHDNDHNGVGEAVRRFTDFCRPL